MSTATPLVLAVNYGDRVDVVIGTVGLLADLTESRHYGADVEIQSVMAWSGTAGAFQPVTYDTSEWTYDDQQMAYPIMTVVLPGGRQEHATMKIDGAA